ncbi:MAG: cytidylate kinase-like family protein [Clostridia bacterium]|nr:cytidylate kinase-like family protein [Clostridia bacterium]
MAKRIITISREFGSGGRTIGRQVAEKLGYKFYDAEIIERVIEKSGLSREIVEKYDEYATHKSSFLYSIAINSANASVDSYHGTSFASQVHIAQIKVINEIAEEGNCVIIGRGADYILRDRADVLNVFVYADMKFKCDRVLSLYGETDKKIEDRIKDKDTKRRVFYRSFAMREWGVYQNYHMMLDSGTVGLDRCVDMICDVASAE